jgi:acylphosphatase
MSLVGARIMVYGVVQGVGFRYWTMRKAADLGVNGYVANMPDGSVAIEAEADRSIVEVFIKEVKVGPTYSSVTDLKIEWHDQPKGYKHFNVRHAPDYF